MKLSKEVISKTLISNVESILIGLKNAFEIFTGVKIINNEASEVALEIADVLEKNKQNDENYNYEKLPVFINYDHFFFLNKEHKLKAKFVELNNQAIKYYLINDFGMFCLMIYQQIEAILDKFLELNNKINLINKPKKYKLEEFLKVVLNLNIEELKYDEYYKIIVSIMDLRDFTCHSDIFGASLDEKVQQRYKWVYIELIVDKHFYEKEKSKINFLEIIKEVFIPFLGLYIKEGDYANHLKVKKIENANYSFNVQIGGGLRHEYLDVNTIIRKIENEQIYKIRFGSQFAIQAKFNQYTSPQEQYLKSFINRKNFLEVNESLIWVFHEFNQIYHRQSTLQN